MLTSMTHDLNLQMRLDCLTGLIEENVFGPDVAPSGLGIEEVSVVGSISVEEGFGLVEEIIEEGEECFSIESTILASIPEEVSRVEEGKDETKWGADSKILDLQRML